MAGILIRETFGTTGRLRTLPCLALSCPARLSQDGEAEGAFRSSIPALWTNADATQAAASQTDRDQLRRRRRKQQHQRQQQWQYWRQRTLATSTHRRSPRCRRLPRRRPTVPGRTLHALSRCGRCGQAAGQARGERRRRDHAASSAAPAVRHVRRHHSRNARTRACTRAATHRRAER
jgi:hypothetical protein